jgi:hypothetical protein
MHDMKARINQDLVGHAVGRAIFCPNCRQVLDVETSKLIERRKSGKLAVICSLCWDKIKASIPVEVEVTDGRTGSVTTWIGAPLSEPTVSEADISGEQEELF